jgi:hypothetical protein
MIFKASSTTLQDPVSIKKKKKRWCLLIIPPTQEVEIGESKSEAG